ncbi:MAG TPA: NUDIX hydrolase [Actinomycetota bacterium]
MNDPIRAAGGIVLRIPRDDDGPEVALIHRPRYDDWSFPKGKLHDGEDDETAALREVAEETGLRCAIERELADVTYADRNGRPKVVRYYLMRAEAAEGFVPGHEVDELRWVPASQAPGILSYPHDRDLLAKALDA